jgi:hypothetical protein
VIHLVRGNLSRLEMLKILTGNAALLKAFINSKTDGYLALA